MKNKTEENRDWNTITVLNGKKVIIYLVQDYW